jgi:pimeloyl-ACP methyl ester carboxylesterase
MITETRVRLPGIPLSTRVLHSGEGAPVLLLHGSPDSATEWRPVMDALGPACSCFAPDLPGLGACEEPPPSFDFSRAATNAFLDQLVAGLGVKEPLVLALHDIGGVIGIPWAIEHLDRIRGLVITNTVVFERFPWFGPARLWARTDPVGKAAAFAMMWQVGWIGGRIFRKAFQRISPELSEADLDRMTRDFARDGKSKRSTLRLFRQMVPEAYFDGVDAMVRELIARVPVRIVWGRGDPYIPARYADAFPGAEREVVEQGGHWIPLSAPDRVATAVKAVLASA